MVGKFERQQPGDQVDFGILTTGKWRSMSKDIASNPAENIPQPYDGYKVQALCQHVFAVAYNSPGAMINRCGRGRWRRIPHIGRGRGDALLNWLERQADTVTCVYANILAAARLSQTTTPSIG